MCNSSFERWSKTRVNQEGHWPEYFLKDLVSPIPDISIKSKDELTWHCSKHGDYKLSVGHRLEGRACPKCGVENAFLIRSRNHRIKNPYPSWFIKDLEGSPDRDFVLSLNASTHDKVYFNCDKHGLYKQLIYDHLNGHGCPTCGALSSDFSSSYEKKLESDLLNYGMVVYRSYRGLIKSEVSGLPMELDLYLPDYNLAVECNDLYWHSFEHMEDSKIYNALGCKQNYHHMKWKLCNDKGIQLLQFYEDDLRDKYDICLRSILSKCGLLKRQKIFARKLKVIKVGNDTAAEFYNQFHIQGYGQGRHFALVDPKNTLMIYSMISVVGSASNERDKGSHELNRYATHKDYFVIGGLEKLEKAAERDMNIQRWVSYADLTFSNGALYRHDGWTELTDQFIKPDYKYVYNGKRYHKFNFRIKRFREDPNLEYVEGYSERQLAELNGIRRVYDAGKIKFIKNVQ